MSAQRRQTTSRRQLERRHGGFTDVSGAVGVLDEEAFAEALAQDPDPALALLADLTGATDERLRELARRLAGRVVLDLGRRVGPRRTGPTGRLRTARLPETGGDLDLDASLDALAAARAAGEPPAVDDLRARLWSRPATALCLLVDRSGSMGGDRLAAAAVGAAAVAWRAPGDYSVVAFAEDAIVLRAQDAARAPEGVVDDVLSLRGHGVTDLALALRTARAQLARSPAARKVVLLLSDCRATAGGDPVAEVDGLGELGVLAPEDDAEDARAFAAATGARLATLAGPAAVPDAFATLLPT